MLCFPAQTLEKFCFTYYRPKYSCPIRLQDFLFIIICIRNASISLIFTWDVHQRKVLYETLLFGWLCPDVPSQVQTFLDLPRGPFFLSEGMARIRIGQNVRSILFLGNKSFDNLIHQISNNQLKCDLFQSEYIILIILWSSIPLKGSNHCPKLFA